jgi:hypothetical protein
VKSRIAILILSVLLLVSLATVGCDNGPDCYDGAFAGNWSGPASYAGTASNAPSGLVGSATVHVSTTEPKCVASDGALLEDDLTFTLGPRCVLAGRRTSTHTVQRCETCGHNQCCTTVFVDGTAETSASPCELPLGDGTMNLVIQRGTAHVTASGAFDLTLSGALVDWKGTAEQSAYVTVQFESASRSGT